MIVWFEAGNSTVAAASGGAAGCRASKKHSQYSIVLSSASSGDTVWAGALQKPHADCLAKHAVSVAKADVLTPFQDCLPLMQGTWRPPKRCPALFHVAAPSAVVRGYSPAGNGSHLLQARLLVIVTFAVPDL